jgi:multiple sugar transport system substrate-binding protein
MFRKIKDISLLGVLAVTVTLVACDKTSTEKPADGTLPDATEPYSMQGKTILWLGDFDILPDSTTMSLFDQTGAKIERINAPEGSLLTALTELKASGQTVDMVQWSADYFPKAYYSNWFAPLDDYIDLNDEIWGGGAKALADNLTYDDKHYIIPTALNHTVNLQYDRNLLRDLELDDPYELWKSGNWTWDKFLEMYEVYSSKGKNRYGVTGYFAQPMFYSSGATALKFDGKTLKNNLNDDRITEIAAVMESMGNAFYADSHWRGHYTPQNSLANMLFFSMGDWSLQGSVHFNPDADFFIVPLPKLPDGEHYALTDFSAFLLTAESERAKEVATFIKADRTANYSVAYAYSREEAVLDIYTKEQYKAMQEYMESVIPVWDYAFSYGEKMISGGSRVDMSAKFEYRGAVNNIHDSLLIDRKKFEDVKNTVSRAIDTYLTLDTMSES